VNIIIPLEEALHILLKNAPTVGTINLPLTECFGRVLAEDIISPMDFPPFNRSPLDGYAVQIADILHATPEQPIVLQQIDYVPAGTVPQKIVHAGHATRIMTGGQIPEGADCVVRLEDTDIVDGKIQVKTATGAATNICSQGEEIRTHETVLQKGTVIKEGALGLLAMLGYAAPLVYQKPQVAILATGSELLSPSDPMEPGKIRDSNSYMLLAKVLMAGSEPILLGQEKDDLPAILAKLHEHQNIPLYITTGGASVGDYDLMEQLFHKLDIPILFNRVAIKPGMPILAGIWNDSLLIALSGNPAASSISFEVLVKPLLDKMTGRGTQSQKKIKVKLSGIFSKTSPTRRFVWAKWFSAQGITYAKPLIFQGNGMLKSALEANCLLEIPAHHPPLAEGDEIEAIFL